MNKTKATHVLRLSQEEFETLVQALSEQVLEMREFCSGCCWSSALNAFEPADHEHDGHLGRAEALLARLDTETT